MNSSGKSISVTRGNTITPLGAMKQNSSDSKIIITAFNKHYGISVMGVSIPSTEGQVTPTVPHLA